MLRVLLQLICPRINLNKAPNHKYFVTYEINKNDAKTGLKETIITEEDNYDGSNLFSRFAVVGCWKKDSNDNMKCYSQFKVKNPLV